MLRIIIGAITQPKEPLLVSLTLSSVPHIDTLMHQFWSIKEPIAPDNPSTENELCENWFATTTIRDTSGRFCVALPFRERVLSQSRETISTIQSCDSSHSYGLGDSRNIALKLLYNLERRLSKDQNMYDAYRKFMRKYQSLGHMKHASQPGRYFISYHAVTKQDGDVSKLRVVFDASCSTSSGRSLNEVLCIGPKLQNEITDILLKIRLKAYVFTANISKMYRQILVRPEDCAYQHILWRESPSDEVQEYELFTVTFGISSASFLVI